MLPVAGVLDPISARIHPHGEVTRDGVLWVIIHLFFYPDIINTHCFFILV